MKLATDECQADVFIYLAQLLVPAATNFYFSCHSRNVRRDRSISAKLNASLTTENNSWVATTFGKPIGMVSLNGSVEFNLKKNRPFFLF